MGMLDKPLSERRGGLWILIQKLMEQKHSAKERNNKNDKDPDDILILECVGM